MNYCFICKKNTNYPTIHLLSKKHRQRAQNKQQRRRWTTDKIRLEIKIKKLEKKLH